MKVLPLFRSDEIVDKNILIGNIDRAQQQYLSTMIMINIYFMITML